MSDDDRTRRVNSIGQAGYRAASDVMNKLMESEPMTDEEATATFVAALTWPAINYIKAIGASKEDAIKFISEMYDNLDIGRSDLN
jgi:DNA-binding transcriptional regulator YhcF (GntR family)